MTTDHLQQYLFKKINEIRNRGTLNGNQDPEYLRALKEVSDELSEERDSIIKSFEVLKKFNLL